MTIWKFPVPIEDDFTIEMPRSARVLSVQIQHGVPVLWALVQPDDVKVERRFRVAGTGHPLPAESLGWAFIGTFQIHGGALVFHLFGCPESP